MRNHQSLLAFLLGSVLIGIVTLQGCAPVGVYRERAQMAAVAQNRDYDIPDLNSYGEWIAINPYGRVWRPYVAAGWQPFSYGHWIYSDVGWVWVSYEPFGWVVYHYGSWYYSEDDGWVWVPGYGGWSPAIVDWIQYGDYVCWAPLAARGVVWDRPWEEHNHNVWTVIRAENFTRDNVGQQRITGADLHMGDQPVGVMQRAPGPQEIESRTHQPVATMNVSRDPVSVGSGQIHKMRVPDSETQRIKQYKGTVERDVLRRPSQGEHR
jgi:hypothetical protein